VHLVFVAKYRRCAFSEHVLNTKRGISTAVCTDFEAELVEFDRERNHVHLLVNYPPKVSVSRMVNSLKGVSSRLLKKQHPELHKYYRKGVLWSPSYFAGSCGGAPISVIRQYIEQQ
jgi:putative transposase